MTGAPELNCRLYLMARRLSPHLLPNARILSSISISIEYPRVLFRVAHACCFVTPVLFLPRCPSCCSVVVHVAVPSITLSAPSDAMLIAFQWLCVRLICATLMQVSENSRRWQYTWGTASHNREVLMTADLKN